MTPSMLCNVPAIYVRCHARVTRSVSFATQARGHGLPMPHNTVFQGLQTRSGRNMRDQTHRGASWEACRHVATQAPGCIAAAQHGAGIPHHARWFTAAAGPQQLLEPPGHGRHGWRHRHAHADHDFCTTREGIGGSRIGRGDGRPRVTAGHRDVSHPRVTGRWGA